MEFFYREMRRKTGLLMEGDQPAGGQWNFDHDNRKPAKPDLFRPRPPRFPPDAITEEVLDLVAARFPDHFGTLRPFGWATTRAGAAAALDHFIARALPGFGDEQDAMLAADPTLSHALISPYLNLGLLDPLEVCRRAEAEWRAGRAPLNAVEGSSARSSAGASSSGGSTSSRARPIPNAMRWTRAAPCRRSTGRAHRDELPVPCGGPDPRHGLCPSSYPAPHGDGEFRAARGIDPQQVHAWYLEVYIDAFEWVEAPNTLGMSQFADGGVVGSKPYVSSGAYIDRMSDYCGACAYRVKDRTGARACPFNLLYWHFLDRHRARFQSNPRMAQMYRTWDRMAEDHRRTVLGEAEAFLARLDAGEPV